MKQEEIREIFNKVAKDLNHYRRIPVATYRLQLNQQFKFTDVKSIVPYLHESDLTKFSDDLLLDMQHLLQLSLKALQDAMHPHGINIGLNLGRSAGAGIVEHLHYHIVPRWNGDTNYMPILTGTKVVSEALEASWQKLHTSYKKFSS